MGATAEEIGTQVVELARPLRTAARLLELVAVVSTALGIIGGIVVMMRTGTDFDGNTTHPYIGLGIGLIVTVLIAGTANWTFARALQLFAVQTAASHGFSIVPDRVSPPPTSAVALGYDESLGVPIRTSRPGGPLPVV
jgi:hypothetical protein